MMLFPLLLAAATLPVFKGYEAPRYQQHDRLILRYVREFNAARASWIGGTEEQGATVRRLDPALVKAQMIQESGGNDPVSRAAWASDPLQVNVPGDWDDNKYCLGLRKPRRRNEGTLEKNLRAGIMYLARKGFGKAGQPAGNRPGGRFDGWPAALERYNGRTDATADGQPYCKAYAGRIGERSRQPETHIALLIR